MKILIIHTEYKYKGGESTVVEEEVKLLESAGHNVKLLKFFNNENQLLSLVQLPFNTAAYFKTCKALKNFQPAIVHIHNLHFAGSNAIIYAVKSKGVPMVMTIHNFRLLCPSGTLFHKGKPFHNSLDENFCWTAVRKGVYQNSKLITFWLATSMWLHQKLRTWQIPDKLIFLSKHSKALFNNPKLHLEKKQFIIKPNFTAQPLLNKVVRKDHFLFVGRLSNEKGVELLLYTFSQLDATIKIAGDGLLKELVIKYATKFKNIEYLGLLSKNEIFNQLQSCTALVFPSIWLEGMPLTIIESFACGTPVIASNLGAMATMIVDGYNGLHFDVGDQPINSLSTQIKKWVALSINEKTVYRLNSYNTYLQEYTPENNVQQLTAIYNSVIPQTQPLALSI